MLKREPENKKLDDLLKLDSPYIPKVLGTVDMGQNVKGIVIEYISSSQFVKDYVKLITNNPQELLRICKEAVLGLAELKKYNLGCPEYKDEHFLIDKEGHFKFIDFDENNTFSWDSLSEFIKDQILHNNEVLCKKLFDKFESIGVNVNDVPKNIDLNKVIEAIDAVSVEISQ